MFSIFRKRTVKIKPSALDIFDIPDHKGFTVAVRRAHGRNTVDTFPTLKAAQKFIAMSKKVATCFNAENTYSIRNNETGKFAAYMWQLTRADLAA